MMNDATDFYKQKSPYRFVEFPRILHREGETFIVKNEIEKQKALENGWQLQPAINIEPIPDRNTTLSSATTLDVPVSDSVLYVDSEVKLPTQSPQVAVNAARGGKTAKGRRGAKQ